MIFMIKEIFSAKGNLRKINILYLILILSNIALLAGLLHHYLHAGMHFELTAYEYFSSVIPTIIILGIITSKMGKMKERGGSLYEMGYLIIITLLGLMTSYFSAKSNTAAIFGPYLEMFRIMCVTLIFMLMSLWLKSFRGMMGGDFCRKNLIVGFIVFSLLGVCASVVFNDINGTPGNVRCMVVMVSGLFGGPFVGIPVGLVSGAFRFSLGGTTALPCAVSTIISGIIGSLVFLWNDRKFPSPTGAASLMFLFIGFEMLTVVILTPPEISFPYVCDIYPLMLFASVIGMAIFAVVVKDMMKNPKEDDLEELEEEIGESDSIHNLKDEIEWLKDEIKELKGKK